MAGYIHDDVKEIMDDAKNGQNSIVTTKDWTEDQLKALDVMLQYAWNRGYKSAYKDINGD